MNALPKSGNKRSTSDLHAHTDTQKYNAPGGAGNADYNEKFRQKRTGLSAKDRKDKELELERENNTLKNKKNLLEQEVVKMETKLKRIDELLRSRSLAAGDNTGYDAQDLQRDLQREYDKLKDQNEFTREKVRKLAVIQRGLQSKVVVPNKVDKYAHVQGKLGFASKPQAGNNQYTTLAEDLRRQLVVNEKEIAQLQTQLNKLNLQHHGAEGGMRGADQLRRDIESMYEDIRMTNQEIEKLQINFANNEQIFDQSKNYTEEIQQKIRQVQEQNEVLRNENSRLEYQTREAREIENEIKQIQSERDDLERTITNIISGPFMRKEGQSMQQRMAELEHKVKEKSSLAAKLHEECMKKKDAADKAEQELNKLRGQRDYLAGEHKQATEEFKQKHATNQNARQPNSFDTVVALHNTDQSKYNTMMDDLRQNHTETGAAPAWANLPFLDRMPANAHTDPKQQLQEEIKALQMEKSSFAQELEKAQNLLKLQTDIEKENTQYFQQEIKRLTLIERSTSAKLEELARRADEKQKMINDLEKKMGPKPRMGAGMPGQHYDDDDAQSEFSMVTHESEIRQDENILDFKIETAEFYQESMRSCSNIAEIAKSANQGLITLCTLDFYNHRTETTQMGEGLRPNYQTQFSFKNKVDDFYVSFLQRQPLKLDIYISRNNSAVHMGHAEVILRSLIERESMSSAKTPLIQDFITVYGVGADGNKAIGTIQYKMRLRKPIQESMRYYREKADIQNMTRAAQNNTGALAPAKLEVTIKVKAAFNLSFPYSDVSDVAPFFYYQFFTFDERYSANAAGVNPRFDDVQSFPVTMDARASSYFEQENLEIILFDDHAPIVGNQPEAQAGDDMIGVCRVPLKGIIAGCSSQDKYDIIKPGSNKASGQLEVAISVIDLGQKQNMGDLVEQATELQYGREWEEDLIMRIARPLARMNCEIGLLFGVFSRGQRSCTKEDFKYCCLQRLGLRQEISERELDLFLAGNVYFKETTYIDKEDFTKVFEHAINKARHEAIKDEARDDFTRMTRRNTHNENNYDLGEVRRILGYCVQSGTIDHLREAITNRARGGVIDHYALKDSLCNVGQVPDTDALRFCNFFDKDQSKKIHIDLVLQHMQTARSEAHDNSNAFLAFRKTFEANPKLIIQRFESQDHNQDGVLDLNGFKAAMLVPEFRMRADDCTEVYQILQSPAQGFLYKQWIFDNFPQYMNFFQTGGNFGVDVSGSLPRDFCRNGTNSRLSSTNVMGHTTSIDENKARSAQQKFENYIRNNQTTVGVMFNVLDTNSDKNIASNEWSKKVRAMHLGLDDEEIMALFRKLDKNHSNSISYQEISEMFHEINTQQLIERMQGVLKRSQGMDAESYFNFECKSDPQKKNMSSADFTNLVKSLYPDAKPIDISFAFRYFDGSGKQFISKQDFLRIMNSSYSKAQSSGRDEFLTIEDVIKPLKTRISRNHNAVAQIFQKYDKDHSKKLSAEELANGLRTDYKIELDPTEIRMIQEYFVNRYQKKEVTQQQFTDMLQFKFTPKIEAAEARSALYDIKNACQSKGVQPKDVLLKEVQFVHGDPSNHITTRKFKIAINSLGVITTYNLNNLCKYLEYGCGKSTAQNEGFVSIDLFKAEVDTAYNPGTNNFDASMSGTFGRSTSRAR